MGENFVLVAANSLLDAPTELAGPHWRETRTLGIQEGNMMYLVGEGLGAGVSSANHRQW
jgi:hypothetical protein